jgi:hypothetical protein
MANHWTISRIEEVGLFADQLAISGIFGPGHINERLDGNRLGLFLILLQTSYIAILYSLSGRKFGDLSTPSGIFGNLQHLL